MLAACSGESGPTNPTNPHPPSVATVTVTPDSARVTLFDSLRLHATAKDSQGDSLQVAITWGSPYPDTVYVSPTGEVLALYGAPVTIFATAGGVSGHARITVRIPVLSVHVTPPSATLQIGDTVRLHAAETTANGQAPTDTLVWTSTDSTVANVSQTGLVTATKAGAVTIKAAVSGKSSQAGITITAPPPPVASVTVTPADTTVMIGPVTEFEVLARDSAGDTLSYWKGLCTPYCLGPEPTSHTTDTSVARTQGCCEVIGLAAGIDTLVATVGGVSGRAVARICCSVAAVVLTPDSGRLITTGMDSLHAEVHDSTGAVTPGHRLHWTVSDTAVAALSDTSGSNVVLLGRSAGTVKVIAASGGKADTGTFLIVRPSVADLIIRPDTGTIFLESTRPVSILLDAQARDSVGDTLFDRLTHWHVVDTALVSWIDTIGEGFTAIAKAAGTARIIATGDTRSDTATIRVVRPSVAKVLIGPDTTTIVVPATVVLSGAAYDSTDLQLPRSIHWKVVDTAFAALSDTIGDNVTVSGKLAGTARIVASSEGKADTALVHIVRPSVATVRIYGDTSPILHRAIRQLQASAYDSVGTLLTGRSIAWSSSDTTLVRAESTYNSSGYSQGQVESPGVGTATVSITSEGVTTHWSAHVYAVHYDTAAIQSYQGCALTSDDTLTYCWGGGEPKPLSGAPHLATITVGGQHSCGTAMNGSAYCWGNDDYGQLGDGGAGTTSSARPVSGGFTFQGVSAGWRHSCGVSSTGAALCWGDNTVGQLGTGDVNGRLIPAVVTGAATFIQVSAGDWFTCALDAAGSAFCWGSNAVGQLGTGSVGGTAATPQAMTGSLQFTSISAGAGHACGLTTAGQAYCWGSNSQGQLGTGDTIARASPTLVVGGHTFRSVSVGSLFACGVTTTNQAYCWGVNTYGQLGNGSQSKTSTPAAVAGGIAFQSVSAGYTVACGVGATGAYCWGNGPVGSWYPGLTPQLIWGNP